MNRPARAEFVVYKVLTDTTWYEGLCQMRTSVLLRSVGYPSSVTEIELVYHTVDGPPVIPRLGAVCQLVPANPDPPGSP